MSLNVHCAGQEKYASQVRRTASGTGKSRITVGKRICFNVLRWKTLAGRNFFFGRVHNMFYAEAPLQTAVTVPVGAFPPCAVRQPGGTAITGLDCRWQTRMVTWVVASNRTKGKCRVAELTSKESRERRKNCLALWASFGSKLSPQRSKN